MAGFRWKKEEVKKEDTKWGFGEFKNFFNQEGKKWGNSDLFKNVQKAFTKYDQALSQAVSEQSAMDLISAHQALLSACENYVTKREGALTSSGKERFNAISKLMEFQKDFHKQRNLDEIRDLRLVRELKESNKDKTWEQMGPIRIPEIELSGKAEKAGDMASERLKVEYGGQKGFFTAEKKKYDSKGYLKEMIQQVDEKRNPKLKEALEANQNAIIDSLDKLTAPVKKDKMDVLEINKSDVKEYQMKFQLANAWDTMETGGATREIQAEKEKAKREFGKAVLASDDGFKITSKIMDSYHNKLNEYGMDPKDAGELQKRKELLEQAINENKEAGEDLSRALKENKNALVDLPAETVRRDRVNAIFTMAVKGELIQQKAKLGENDGKKMEQLDLLIHDDKTVRDLIKVQRDAWSAEMVGNVKTESEIVKRNVATSRVAELLGLGDLAAHSRKMIVKADGKTIEGSFMEFAKGIDPNSYDDPSIQQKFLEIGDDFATPEFNKAAHNMAIFDNLCGQQDRHENNLFYQLSEPDANGKRKVLGFQGIDNDLSFGLAGKNFGGNGVIPMEDIHFIDREMADKLKKLDRNALEFAVGDLLSKEEMDAMEERMKNLQERAVSGQMVVIDSDNQWALNEYKLEDYAAKSGTPIKNVLDLNLNKPGLDERGKNYVKGLLEMTACKYREVNLLHQGIHRDVYAARHNAGVALGRRDAVFSDMQEMFKEEPVREKVGVMGLADPSQRRNFNSAGKKAPEPPTRTNNRFLGERNSQAQTANTEQKQSERRVTIGKR